MADYYRYVRENYDVSEEERRAAGDWLNAHTLPRCQPLNFEMRFRSTGMGLVVVVRCTKCGNDCDVTDYGFW